MLLAYPKDRQKTGCSGRAEEAWLSSITETLGTWRYVIHEKESKDD